jgi:hypothetical protein
VGNLALGGQLAGATRIGPHPIMVIMGTWDQNNGVVQHFLGVLAICFFVYKLGNFFHAKKDAEDDT